MDNVVTKRELYFVTFILISLVAPHIWLQGISLIFAYLLLLEIIKK